ncbi:hypothetical protein EUX98_g440 [Antrodiella citrinella]|uniref:General negative regulator of transcription subunit n=1 Tax=Antrodiella citrinella TaxID=2447956 RepID=A0A4S4N3X7_9APHY|nr:hypothetical protein EUX98_g440 [Antrodiella citrinella]
MAARKLQTEIDRTLKKVAEGVELFESIYDKMQASTNQTQKEKLETDLKTQIKKLQRLRDQIKTWVASNDIKDKTSLLDNRRLIETQMEKFKACEKEMKTKAFSKEGLIQSAKLDPKAQEKMETTQWLQTQVEELLLQVEQAEAEIETLQGGGKKKNKGSAATERQEELERLNERRKWHISRLEIILRLLDNGSMLPERIIGLKDDVSYFVESNTEEDFEEDDGIYDELNLDEEEEKFGLAVDDNESEDSEDTSEVDLPPRTPSKKHQDEESVSSSKRDGSPVTRKATGILPLRKPSIASETTKPPPNPNFAQQPMSSILKAGLPTARPAVLPVRYATAAAAAVSPPATSQAAQTSPPSQLPTTPTTASSQPIASTAPSITPSLTASTTLSVEVNSVVTSSPSLTHPSLTSPMLSSATSAVQGDETMYSAQDSPALSDANLSSVGGPADSPLRVSARAAPSASPIISTQPPAASVEAQASLQTTTNGFSHPPQPSGEASIPVSTPATQQAIQSMTLQPPIQPQQPQYPPGVSVLGSVDPLHAAPSNAQPQSQTIRPPSAGPQQLAQAPRQRTPAPNAFPGSLSDLVVSFESVKQKAPHRMSNLDQVHKLLEGSYSSMPQPQDTEKPKYYVPRNPFQTPPYYPQTPSPILSTPGIFTQLDVETLFYVFYFHPGTYQQYLAAKELKRQSWRFHVKYLTWFQRHSEPQAITEEYEQGVYVYFDWEGSWCQRKKSDFRFEYRYLSED